MADMIPEYMPDSATQGERRVFAALQALPDNVVVYYEPVIQRRYPDFIVLAPEVGVVVVEVKGLRLKSITQVDAHSITYLHGGVVQHQQHPSRQAREYMNGLMNACSLHPAAAELKTGKHFSFAFGRLAILTSIRRAELDDSPWAEHFPRGMTLCADELDSLALAPAAWMSALRAAINPDIPITPIPVERARLLRSVISPSSRIETGWLFGDESPKLSIDVMDLEQERVARQLGTGHRILYGVPGSGKTIVLVAAARLLAEAKQSVLLLCYNRALQEHLGRALKGYPSANVRTFGVWGLMQGAPKDLSDRDAFGQTLLDILDAGRGDAGRYDAVLIDEGQDFPPSWFQCAVQALKEPQDGTLIVAYDVSQNLYRAKLPNWSKVGIKAQGRTRRFVRNYRNTREIAAAAWSFGLQEAPGDDDQPSAVALRQENCARNGPWPVMIRESNLDAQIGRCIGLAKDLTQGAQSLKLSEVMFLCPRNSVRDRVEEALGRHGMKAAVTTIHGARGLQAKAVVLVGADTIQGDEARAMMYVALTRPTDQLYVLWSHDTPSLKELMRNLETAGAGS